MKLIEANRRAATVKFSRTEFENLSQVLGMTFYMMNAGARDGVLKFTNEEREIDKVLLPKIYALFQRLTRIALENGWLDYEEDDDAGRTRAEKRRWRSEARRRAIRNRIRRR